MKDDIINQNFKIIQSEMKSLKDLTEEIDNDITSLIQWLEHIEDKQAENYNEQVHNDGKIDDCYIENQKKRIKEWAKKNKV